MFLKIFLVSFTILAIAGGCSKEDPIDKSACNSLSAALATNDSATVRSRINSFAEELQPVENTYEPTNIRDRLNKLVGFLNGNCNIKAELLCVECIYTIPPISEIKLQYVNNGQLSYKLIDLHTVDNALKFAGMHD